MESCCTAALEKSKTPLRTGRRLACNVQDAVESRALAPVAGHGSAEHDCGRSTAQQGGFGRPHMGQMMPPNRARLGREKGPVVAQHALGRHASVQVMRMQAALRKAAIQERRGNASPPPTHGPEMTRVMSYAPVHKQEKRKRHHPFTHPPEMTRVVTMRMPL